MIHSEYTRSLNCNYQRIMLDKKPEEKRYQYCILSRGGIKGLLGCDLRYINGQAYLYYDITSKQNVAQMYMARSITREWLKDFLWSLKQIQQELGRFLLDVDNILWYPEQIFQDLETNRFCFLYVPYYEGDSGFGKLMEFLAEHINYGDEVLVDCIYHIYEQFEKVGLDYLQTLIFEDTKCLEDVDGIVEEKTLEMRNEEKKAQIRNAAEDKAVDAKRHSEERGVGESVTEERFDRKSVCGEKKPVEVESKKGLLGMLEGKKNRNRKQREDYRRMMHREMAGYAVAEDTVYMGEEDKKASGNIVKQGMSKPTDEDEDLWEGEYGRTIYVEASPKVVNVPHRLLSPEGKLLVTLDKPMLSIGKKKEEVDLVFEEASVSRMHARITIDKDMAYLEDLNSTNGTFKNGLRLQPYEKRKLDEGDEIRCGRVAFVFR